MHAWPLIRLLSWLAPCQENLRANCGTQQTHGLGFSFVLQNIFQTASHSGDYDYSILYKETNCRICLCSVVLSGE